MPLPPLEAIQEIGRRLMEGTEDIDACVVDVLDLSTHCVTIDGANG
jgi:hypothetical protein